MTATRKSDQTRQRILSTGRDLVLQGGFGGIGLSRILQAADVPKGSFYHYFASKEAFGCAMLDDYVSDYLARVDALTAGPGLAGDKLAGFWQGWLTADGIAARCLVVKLAAEVADLSEDMRRILDQGVSQLCDRIADLLRQGAADGSVRALPDPDAMAATLYAQWLGAAVLAKLSNHDAPLRLALADTTRRLTPPQTKD